VLGGCKPPTQWGVCDSPPTIAGAWRSGDLTPAWGGGFEEILTLLVKDISRDLSLLYPQEVQDSLYIASVQFCRAGPVGRQDGDTEDLIVRIPGREQGRVEEAIWHNSQAVRIKPDYLEAINGLGLSYHDADRLDEAIACYRKALEIHPTLTAAHVNLGSALVEKGNLEEAVWHYKQALQKLDLAIVRSKLAYVLIELGRFPDAVREYRKLLRRLPGDPKIHNRLGIALFKDGKIDEGIAHIREALRLKPDFPEARNNLRIMLAKREELKKQATPNTNSTQE